MPTIALQPLDSAEPQPIAPYWHTAILVGVMATLAMSGAAFQHHALSTSAATSPHSPIPLYLSVLAAEWGLFTFARKGAAGSGTTLTQLIGPDGFRMRGLARDLLLGLALWCVWELFGWGWTHALGTDGAASIQSMLPRSPLQMGLWVAVSLSAGFCEEVAFRGYCQRQFAALTHSRWLGLLAQALLFGISHGYEGLQSCIRIMIYAALFTLLAFWRKSLRAGMFGHAWTDIVAGLFGF